VNEASHSQIPSPLETELLRAALLDGESAIAAYRRWAAQVDVDSLDGGSQRMLPLLASNLGRLGVEDELIPALHGHRRQSLAANAHTIAGTREALRALAAAGIETLVLKGAALVASGLCELSLRPIGDVDVLVRPQDRAAAIDVLVAEGWETNIYPSWYVRRTLYREHPAWVWSRDRAQLDLHWSALHLVRDPAAETPLWQRAMATDIGGVPVLVPSIEDQAMQAWLHAAEHNPVPPLRWVADAVTAIDARDGAFDWDHCVEAAIAQRTIAQTRAALDYLASKLDKPVPSGVLARLRQERVTRLERREHAARNRPPAERNRVDAAVVALQDHRRQSVALLSRSPLTGALDLRRARRRRPDSHELHDLRDGALVLDRDADPLDSLLYGWSFPEPSGRWTDGPEAAVAVRVEPEAEALLVADLSAFVGTSRRRQRVTIRVGGRRYATLRFGRDDVDLRPREVRIPVPPTPDGTVELTFAISSPRAPTSLGLTADERRLGLLLRSLRLA
jgi:hypothetical protein